MVGMAEGADLLVARAALDRNLGVDAVLPMPLADYAADFSPEALRELRELLDDPRVTSVVLDSPAELGGSIPQTHGTERNLFVCRAVERARPQEQRADHAVERRVLGTAGRHGGHGDALSRRALGAAAGRERVVRGGTTAACRGTGRSSTGCSCNRARDAGEETATAPSFLSGAGEGCCGVTCGCRISFASSSAISITTTKSSRRYRPSRMRRAPTR